MHYYQVTFNSKRVHFKTMRWRGVDHCQQAPYLPLLSEIAKN